MIQVTAKIHSESETMEDGVQLGMMTHGIPTLPGRAPHIELRDFPNAVVEQIGSRGKWVRITFEAIDPPVAPVVVP
jgi:hypothetical protein